MRTPIYFAAALVAGVLAILALDLTTVRVVDRRRAPARELAVTADRELGRQLGSLVRARLATAAASPVLDQSPGPSFAIHSLDGSGLVARETVENAAGTLLDDLPAGAPGARVGLILLDSHAFARSVAREVLEDPAGVRVYGARSGILMGGTTEAPWCARIAGTGGGARSGDVVLPSVAEAGQRVLSDLSLCAWVARYGLPGPDVARWLQDTGTRPAGPLGRWTVSDGTSATAYPVFQACRAGTEAACDALFTNAESEWTPGGAFWRRDASPPHPDWAGNEQLLWFSPATSSPPDPVLSGVLSVLREEYGDEAMARFWRSDAPLDEAFQDAFGMSPGRWYREWLTSRIRPYRAGPGPQPSHLVAILLALVFGVVSTAAVTGRRTVA